MKGILDLKKIVILTDHPERRDTLTTCLSILFPECQIQLKPKEMVFLKMSKEIQRLANEDMKYNIMDINIRE